MNVMIIKDENDYLSYIDTIKSFSKNESAEYNARHKAVLNTKQKVIGVAMANIRMLAKQIYHGGYVDFLEISIPKKKEDQFYEETLIEGLVIAQIKDRETMLKYLDNWIPKIDNWSTCDSVTSSFKHIKMNENYFEYFYNKSFDEHEFIARVGITVLMNCFLDEKYLDKILKMCEKIKNDAYYVKMAVAWLLSYCFIKFRDKTLKYFKNNSLDKFTHNKAISKCRDSFQVSSEDKEMLKDLRR